MLYILGFEHLGVVVSDLYFLDPRPGPGQEGAERGVRVELRRLERQPDKGSIYAARPILVGRPLWRVDLLESVGNPGSLDRAHHHPKMQGWEPGSRRFEESLSTDPIGWLEGQFNHLQQFVDPDELEGRSLDADFEQLRSTSRDIVEEIRAMLAQVGSGDLAREPAGSEGATLIRSGWL